MALNSLSVEPESTFSINESSLKIFPDKKSNPIPIDDLFQILLRYLSVFFAIDGAKIIDSKLVEQLKPILLKICEKNPEKYSLFQPIFNDL